MRIWRWILRAYYADLGPEEAERLADLPYRERIAYLTSEWKRRTAQDPSLLPDRLDSILRTCFVIDTGLVRHMPSQSVDEMDEVERLATLVQEISAEGYRRYAQLRANGYSEEMETWVSRMEKTLKGIREELDIETALPSETLVPLETLFDLTARQPRSKSTLPPVKNLEEAEEALKGLTERAHKHFEAAKQAQGDDEYRRHSDAFYDAHEDAIRLEAYAAREKWRQQLSAGAPEVDQLMEQFRAAQAEFLTTYRESKREEPPGAPEPSSDSK